MSISLGRFCLVLLLGLCLAKPLGNVQAATLGDALVRTAAPEEEKSEGGKHELIYKIINSALLIAGLVILLRKPMARFFAGRSASIQKGLEEGRKALEASQAQLAAVEEKLRRLAEEIAAFKASAAKEIEADRERLKQATAEEAEKILTSARAQMETAVRAAKLELKGYAAQQAVELAEQMIRERMDEASRSRLVSQFIARLDAKAPKN